MSHATDTNDVGMRVNATDPTESLSLRKSFKRDLNGRVRDVRGGARNYLEGANVDGDQARLLRSFRSYVDSELTDSLVDPVPPKRAQAGRHWTGTYVRQAYDKGLRLARQDLRALGGEDFVSDSTIRRVTSAHRDEHRSARAREFLTAYYGVEDVGNRLEKHATQTAEGELQRSTSASEFADTVTADLRNRAGESVTALASMVVVETINEALLTTYELTDEVNGVGVLPESDAGAQGGSDGGDDARQNAARENAAGELAWQTAGDEDVCPECQAIAGAIVYISEIQNRAQFQPPIHPNCRCRLVPTSMEDED